MVVLILGYALHWFIGKKSIPTWLLYLKLHNWGHSMIGTFEERLTKLEENILPIYNETEDFQRLQVNVDQTLEVLDSVIDFYTIGKEVEHLIRHSIYRSGQ